MNHKRTIIGAFDYSLETLKNMKATLMDVGAHNAAINWGVGAMIISMVSNLLMISQQVIDDSKNESGNNAKTVIANIQAQMNDFFDQLIENN